MIGKFIVLYGVNNIGKTTQAKMLKDYLESKGKKVFYFKIPVYELQPTGPKINDILRSKKQDVSEEEFQLLYAQNRKDFQQTIKQKLEQGQIVIAEDYTGTGLAWGNVKGASMEYLEKINNGLIKEDISILLDGKRFLESKEVVHIHEQNSALVEKVRNKFLELAKKFDWKIIDANQPKEKVFSKVKKEVDDILS
jgi:dTMP kinase